MTSSVDTAVACRRGPCLGGCKSRKTYRSVRDRSRARLSARQSVQCVPVMARSLGRLRREGTQQERSRTRIALALQVCTTAAHGDVDAAPMKSCSDSDLQVFDLKAAVALRVSHTAGADDTGSFRVKLAQPSMHHAPTRGCRQASADRRRTAMNPSSAHAVLMPQRFQTLLGIGHDAWRPRGAAIAAQQRQRRPRLLFTAYAPQCSGSTLGTLE